MRLATALTSTSDFTQPEEGTSTATVVGVVDLGTQPEDTIKGGPKAGKVVPAGPKLLFVLEVVDQPQPDGRATLLNLETTWNMTSKGPSGGSKLFKLVSAALGSNVAQAGEENGVDPVDLLGKSVLVDLAKATSSSTRVSIRSTSSLLRGQNVTKAQTKPYSFDFDAPDNEVYNKLADWVKAKIEAGGAPIAGSKADNSNSVEAF